MEDHYAPTLQAQRISLAQLVEQFTKAGLPCKLEPESKTMSWLVFEGRESSLLATVEENLFSFATFQFSPEDPAWVGQTVEEVMTAIGFSADEEAQY